MENKKESCANGARRSIQTHGITCTVSAPGVGNSILGVALEAGTSAAIARTLIPTDKSGEKAKPKVVPLKRSSLKKVVLL